MLKSLPALALALVLSSPLSHADPDKIVPGRDGIFGPGNSGADPCASLGQGLWSSLHGLSTASQARDDGDGTPGRGAIASELKGDNPTAKTLGVFWFAGLVSGFCDAFE